MGWNVFGVKVPERYVLTARSACCGTVSVTGSLHASAPAGMVSDGLPPNVSVRSDPAVIVPPDCRSATCAAATTRGDVENLFVSFTRTWEPPSVVQTIVRSVWFLSWLGTVA